MFGVPSTRIAELSRPNYAHEVEEYARLEHPQEEARTILLLALKAAKDHSATAHRHFWSFRTLTTPEAVSEKA